MKGRVHVCSHPLMQETLARLRDKATPPPAFRELMERAGELLSCEALAEVRVKAATVATPLKAALARRVDQPVALVVVLRAGLGLLPGALRLVPQARVGHIGLYRDEQTLNPVRYYVRLPKDLGESLTVLLDPMLATGGSLAEAVRILKLEGARKLAAVTLLATRVGIRRVHREHPDVPIFTAAVDPVLNRHGYIVPGLGDAGDRLFGTL